MKCQTAAGRPGGRLVYLSAADYVSHAFFITGPNSCGYPTAATILPYWASLPNVLPFVLLPNSHTQDLVSVQYG